MELLNSKCGIMEIHDQNVENRDLPGLIPARKETRVLIIYVGKEGALCRQRIRRGSPI